MPLIAEYDHSYAELYDHIYRERDTSADACRALQLVDPPDGGRLLDFGCGTGAHALEFAAAGFEVLGCDASEAMIEMARRKTDAMYTNLEWLCGSTPELLERCGPGFFDGAASLFNVLNCLPTAADMLRHLQGLGRLLKPGGRLLLELWNGTAVLADRPRLKVRVLPLEDGDTLEQVLTPRLDPLAQCCTLDYMTTRRAADGHVVQTHHHLQRIHFLTDAHYRELFDRGNLHVEKAFPVSDPRRPLSACDWFAGYLLVAAE